MALLGITQKVHVTFKIGPHYKYQQSIKIKSVHTVNNYKVKVMSWIENLGLPFIEVD